MAKKLRLQVIVMIFTAISITFLGYSYFISNGHKSKVQVEEPEIIEQEEYSSLTPPQGIESVIRGEQTKEENSALTGSGPVRILPWEGDEAFIKAQEDNHTPVLMGAYCAVLKDPLPGEEFNVHHGASLLSGKVVEPGQLVSQNKEIGPYSLSKGFREGPTYVGTQVRTTIGGGVCKIASTLYNVSILSNLEIVERHNHSMPVPYVPYGQDATVAYGVKDFKFKNNTPFSILIWAQGIGNRLYIAFYGQQEPPKIEWKHEFLRRQEAPILYKKSSELSPGAEKMILEGMDGATVRSQLIITYPDGKTEEKKLGVSYYNPMPYVIEKGN